MQADRYRLGVPVLLLTAALVLAACGNSKSSSSGNSTTATGGESTSVPQLNVSVASPVISIAGFWIAEGDGLFQKNNVQVNVTSYTGFQTMAGQMEAGQVDVGVTSVGLALALPDKGIASPLIYGLYRSDWSEFSVIAGKSFTSYQALAAKGTNCRIAQPTPGSTIYGYTEDLIKKYNLKCQKVLVASPTAVVDEVVSGAVDIGLTYPYLDSQATSSGKVKVVFNPYTATAAEGQALFPTNVLTAGVWVTQSALKTKKASLERFVKALDQAYQIIQTSSPQKLGQITANVKQAWGTVDPSLIASQWQLAKAKALDGEVSQDMWQTALKVTKNVFGSPVVNLSNPLQAYSKAVDMSLLPASSG